MPQGQQQGSDLGAYITVVSQRRMIQQVADRVDRVGYMLDSLIVKTNANTVTGWVDADATALAASIAAPTFYVDPATSKAFIAVK